MTATPDDRTPVAKALALASTVTSVSLEMVVPIFIGYALDVWLGTRAVFAIAGGALGLTLGLFAMVRLARRFGGRSTTPKAD